MTDLDPLQAREPSRGRGTLMQTAGELNVRELVQIVLSGWPVLIAALTVAGVIGAFRVFVTPNQYKTDATIQIESNSNTARIAFAQVSDMVSADSTLGAEQEILRSRSVLGRVVDQLGLADVSKPKFFPMLGEAFWRRYHGKGFGSPPWFLRLFSRPAMNWGGERLVVSRFDTPEANRNDPFRIRAAGDDRFEFTRASGELLATGRVGEPLLVTLGEAELQLFVQVLSAPAGREFTIRKRPRLAAISELRAKLSIKEIETGRFGGGSGLVRLVYRGDDRREVVRVLEEVLSVYQRQNVERNSAEASQTLAFLREQLPLLKERVENSEASLNQYRIDQGSADLSMEAAALLERNVELERQQQQLLQQRKEGLLNYTDEHPVIRAVDSRLTQLADELKQLDGRIRKLPEVQQASLRLSRDLQVSTQLYISLLNRAQELEVVQSGTIGSVRIVDEPVAPMGPYAPDRLQILSVALMVGLIAGLGLIWALHMLRDGVSDPGLIESATGIPVYGTVPYSKKQRLLERSRKAQGVGGALLTVDDPHSIASEAIRSIRTALHFAMIDARNNVVMLTGPEPGIGKSFISSNLGAALAVAQKRVLLIDADLRRGKLHSTLNLERERGLSEVIAGELSAHEAIKSSQVAKLDVVTTGSPPPNPAELLMNERFVEALEGWSSAYDVVIVDTPPSLGITDSTIIGRHCAATMVVLKVGQHSMRMVEDTVGRLQTGGVDVRGVILNQADRSALGAYGYGYRYGQGYYQYQYKSNA